jgi:phenylpropionate dioxygenase-like ring-hydroxylating dioxygenase large terminal subunit
LNKPTQVTVFDVDYVIAKIPSGSNGETIVAMEDKCPHKSAFLSEGRVTSSGHFQCAYHGWTFDGTDGTCVEIPQVVTKGGDMPILTARACGTAVPAMMEQGMVWLFPGGNLETALLAPPPPTVPEIDMEGYSVTTVVRDFPIDYSILLENILDPDHGLFSHGVLGFDLYSASRDEPQEIEEEFLNNGKGWRITSRVDAVDKLIKVDKSRRGKQVKEVDESNVPVATSTFTAPNHVFMGRRNKETGETSFVTAFWICPTGTGRSRFMSAAVAKIPFSVPRWFMHVNLNNFLDQDTHLLATQQRYILDAEAEIVGNMSDNDIANKSTNVRKSTYVYRSPTERLGARLGTFWDETLNRAPNRVSTLLAMSNSGVLKQTPSRRVTLDREEQHLRICPDSRAVVKNCNRVRVASAAVGLSLLTLKTCSNGSGALWSQVACLLKPNVLKGGLGISLAAWWLAGKLRREFYFKYTEELRDRDLKNIPKIWLEK